MKRKRISRGRAGTEKHRIPQDIFIPASNEPSVCNIWRLPRGSNTPLLCSGVFDFGKNGNCVEKKNYMKSRKSSEKGGALIREENVV